VVHNTDSVMIEMPVTQDQAGLELAYKWGPVMAEFVTKTFHQPIKLEFEKVYYPYLLFKKKRYWGKKYENSTVKYTIESKGTDDVRRNSFLYTSNLLKQIRRDLIENASPEAAKATVHRELQQFMHGDLPFDQFILSKSLRDMSDYKEPEKQMHINVVQKMAKRNPGSEPLPGNRVPFVIVNTKSVKDKAFQKSEDPVFAQENGLRLDLLYYFEHYVKNPVLSVFELIDPDLEIYFARLIIQMQNQQRGQRTFDVPIDFKCAPPPRKKSKSSSSAKKKQKEKAAVPQKSNLSQFFVKKTS
jgi:DNA polymerase delta subunit 1